jgi:hypothetical protein
VFSLRPRLALRLGWLAAALLTMAAPAQAQPAAGPPGAEGGRVQILLFGPDNRALAGSVVEAAGARATTNENGAAVLEVPEGTHTIRVRVPKSLLPATPTSDPEWRLDLTGIVVVAGELTDVIATLGATGALLNLDLQAPEEGGGPRSMRREFEEAAARKPHGKVQGTIVAAEDRAKVQGASVYVRGAPVEAQSDASGQFTLDLPEGTYQLSVIHPRFSTQSVPDVVVKGGETAKVDVSMSPASVELDELVVTAPHIQGGIAAVLDERKKSATVTDAVGAADIRRSPDSTASAATRRVVGASVVGGQFLFVRGLGGRYSNVRLNGVPLPSTDPDLPGFQIDLFPSSLLSSLTISKTFSPDIPGDFAGGSLNVETDTFPEKFKLNVSFGGRYNTQSTFKRSPTYHGGDTDPLGFDDGTRAMPKGIPNERVEVASRGQEGYTREEVNEIGKLFPNNWRLLRSRNLPSMSGGLSVGDTLRVGGRKLGYLATAGYRLNYVRYDEHVINVRLAGEGPTSSLAVRDDYKRELGKEEAQIGVLGNLSYEVANGHTIRLVSLLTQTSEDNTSVVTGHSDDRNGPIEYSQYQFVQRQLLFNQLLGEHLDLIGPLQLNWQLNAARVRRDQPDTRDVLYEQEEDVFVASTSSPVSGQHLYTQLDQRDFGGGLDLTLPVKKLTAKAGYLGRFSDRGFSARRFKPQLRNNLAAEERALAPEELFVPENYGVAFDLREVTLPDDGYRSEERLNASYAMADVAVREWLRLMAGLRLEAFHQAIDISTPYATMEPATAGTAHDYLDVLPAAALILRLTEEMNLRFAYGLTVARPLARELAPFLSQDFVRRRNTQGNPNLTRTTIQNIDARWEYFPSGSEVLAASVFYKVFRDPIERVILNSAGDGSYQNIDEATNYGAELEARLSLGRIADALEDFNIGGNLALVKSEVSLTEEQRAQATSDKRPLGGQSPYVVNLSLGWTQERLGLSAFIYYNVYGRRIDEVGFVGLPDSYEQPFHSLDLTAFVDLGAGFNLGASAVNLLGQSLVFKQGDIDVSRSYRGRDFGLRLSWTY